MPEPANVSMSKPFVEWKIRVLFVCRDLERTFSGVAPHDGVGGTL
jgi:hypothetical protein